jgi:predicted O-linked N-acetylglucosamine transferase (SPINDLY family)
MISRQTASFLSRIGVTYFTAADKDGYVNIAIALSRDVERLAIVRNQLWQQLALSPVCNSETFTSDLEQIYREVWEIGCAQGNGDTHSV